MSENEKILRCSKIVKRTENRVKRLCNERHVKTERPKSGHSSSGPTDVDSIPSSSGNKLRRSSSLTIMCSRSCCKGDSSSVCSSESLKYIMDGNRDRRRRDELIWRVLYTFCRNVCKKRKQQSDSLSSQLDKANETSSKLNIQISLLKSIIRSDETIRESWKKRLLDVKKILGSALEENLLLKNEFEEVSTNVDKIKDKMTNLETENNNYKNTQIMLKSECSAFEQQLKKERDSNALLRYESELQLKKLCKQLKEKNDEKECLLNEIEELRNSLNDKSHLLEQTENSLQNASRLWQNSVKEIQQLNKETSELRKVNKGLKEKIVSIKNSMSLLENNQEQIYKYFSLNID